MSDKISAETSRTTETTRITSSRSGGLLVLSFLLALVASPAAFGDSLAPCEAGNLATIANTSCTIGDIIYNFGTPEFPQAQLNPSAVTFSPILSAPDNPFTNINLTIFGPFSLTDSGPGTGVPILAVNLPVTIATVDGQRTIIGAAASAGVLFSVGTNADFIGLTAEFLLCDSNDNCITPFFDKSTTATMNDTFDTFPISTQFLSDPVSSLLGGNSEASLSLIVAKGTASVTELDAEFGVLRSPAPVSPIPEPSSLMLITTGLLGVLGTAGMKLLR
jgi:hypothetical protein